MLRMNFYIGILAHLQEYVKVFQGKEILVHKLHDKQLRVYLKFLACFIKPENMSLQKTACKLQKLDVTDPANQMKQKDHWYSEANKVMMKDKKDTHVVEFMQQAEKAFCGMCEKSLTQAGKDRKELLIRTDVVPLSTCQQAASLQFSL
jgi:hypothetical protein